MRNIMRLGWLVLILVAALRDISACKNDEDCEFNGACSGGACVCDKGWTGTSCGTLLLDPNPVIAYGHGSPGANNHSSWGGGPPVYDPATGKYNLFVSEISAHCGMSTWMRMSQSVRATADTIEGPYEFEEVIIGTESHNAYYVYSEPDDMHLIYTLFAGDSPAYCNPPPPGCRNGITPGGNKLRYKGEWADNTCKTVGRRIAIFYSRSLTGPWERHLVDFSYGSEGRPFNAGTSNPAPYVFPNGTVIMLSRGKDAEIIDGKVVGLHNIWLYRAKSWNATYEWVPSNGENGALKVGGGKPLTEDPTLWRGRRGFHILFHSNPGLTHAWSKGGIIWDWNRMTMGPGGVNERPRVVLDDSGDLEWVFVAQLLPPEGGSLVGDASRTAAFRTLKQSEGELSTRVGLRGGLTSSAWKGRIVPTQSCAVLLYLYKCGYIFHLFGFRLILQIYSLLGREEEV
uniref:EGF-like domain-containing protein n=1 Tax=Helicotheca tamesis TaxID=374047 RepID=A0A7S2I2G0_9STRA|mmetsp:Transcript_4638/g.6347  ORF Transcript_4638/g.6347 Transcript_4638/m.6347 type:complete len:456 (+) Transcript_4638:35-1402(+)